MKAEGEAVNPNPNLNVVADSDMDVHSDARTSTSPEVSHDAPPNASERAESAAQMTPLDSHPQQPREKPQRQRRYKRRDEEATAASTPSFHSPEPSHFTPSRPLSWSYVALAVFRAVVCLLPLSYVHPDEFCQAQEVGASDVYRFDTELPWEFTIGDLSPARSIIFPYVTSRTSYHNAMFARACVCVDVGVCVVLHIRVFVLLKIHHAPYGIVPVPFSLSPVLSVCGCGVSDRTGAFFCSLGTQLPSPLRPVVCPLQFHFFHFAVLSLETA